jgi:predicted DNA-binding transcriptional regulator AlpA
MRSKSSLLSSTAEIAPPRIAPTHDPLIGTTEVATELMCHPVSVFRKLRNDPDFPVPIRISSNRLAWRLSTIRTYVASRPLRQRTTTE